MSWRSRERDEVRTVPRLQYEADRWILAGHGFRMAVRVAWNGEGWFEYRFYVYDQGVEYQAVTNEQYEERVQAIEENDGNEASALWIAEQRQVTVVPDDHPAFQLQNHWEAMIELGMFFPTVTLGEWTGGELHRELLDKMNAARAGQTRADMETERWS